MAWGIASIFPIVMHKAAEASQRDGSPQASEVIWQPTRTQCRTPATIDAAKRPSRRNTGYHQYVTARVAIAAGTSPPGMPLLFPAIIRCRPEAHSPGQQRAVQHCSIQNHLVPIRAEDVSTGASVSSEICSSYDDNPIIRAYRTENGTEAAGIGMYAKLVAVDTTSAFRSPRYAGSPYVGGHSLLRNSVLADRPGCFDRERMLIEPAAGVKAKNHERTATAMPN